MVWVLAELVLRSRSRSRHRRDPEWTLAFVIAVLCACALAGLVAASKQPAPLPGSAWWPVVLGLILLWAGGALRLWSVATLGRFFVLTVTIQEDHRVINDGPYRWIRHPSYLGVIIAAAGVGVLGDDWLSIAALLAGTVIAILVRIRVEERALIGALGEEYAAYAQRTARLVPGLF